MAKYEGLKRDNGVIINDRWRLVPCEGRNANNWELYDERFESAEELAEHLREYERIVTTMTDALKTALEARQTS